MKNIKTYEGSMEGQENDPELDSQLLGAVSTSDEKRVKELIEQGADPNSMDRALQTALHYAVQDDNVAIVRLLIDAGADIGARDEFSQTPIHWAAFSGSPKAAKILIDNGADPNSTTRRGSTPLIWSVEYDHPEVAKVLINAGVDPFSYFDNNAEFLEFFDFDLLWWKDITPELRNASNRGMRSEDLFGESLTLANLKSYTDVINEQLYQSNLKHAFFEAAIHCHNAKIKRLLKQGANPNEKLKMGSSYIYGGMRPLEMAAYYRGTAIERQKASVKALLEGGADPNLPCEKGSAVYYAVKRPEVLKILLDYGADPNYSGGQNVQTPIQFAGFNQRKESVNMLMAAGADLNGALHSCVLAGMEYEVIQNLLKAGADPNEKDNKGNGILLYVHEFRDKRLLPLFLKLGLDPNETNSSGWTPLHFAARFGRCRKQYGFGVEDLIEAGADVNAGSGTKVETPLSLAVMIGHKDVAKVLLNSGANWLEGFKDADSLMKFFNGDLDWWNNKPNWAKRIERSDDLFGED